MPPASNHDIRYMAGQPACQAGANPVHHHPDPFKPKELDEEAATCMAQGFGGTLTRLTRDQADYIGVQVEGPFKPACRC